MNEWVSINDRLPENSGFYLVWVPIPNYPECNFQPAFFIERKGTFVTPDGADGLNAKYWMAVYRPEYGVQG